VSFLKKHPVDLIQWRNLNIDPIKYLKLMYKTSISSRPIGIKIFLETIKKLFPNLKYGYFNPPKEAFYEMV